MQTARAAPSGFDSESFREACEEENIIPNIKPNLRNSTEKETELSPIRTTIFDEELYKDRSVIGYSNAWTVRCIGRRSTLSHSQSFSYEKSTKK